MGIFSFLFGGKKSKDKVEKAPKAAKAAPAAKAVEPVAAVVASAPAISPVGIVQAKLRLKLAASLRTGQHAAAYQAAQALADIQVRAGRKTVARVWQQQAERIAAAAGLAA